MKSLERKENFSPSECLDLMILFRVVRKSVWWETGGKGQSQDHVEQFSSFFDFIVGENEKNSIICRSIFQPARSILNLNEFHSINWHFFFAISGIMWTHEAATFQCEITQSFFTQKNRQARSWWENYSRGNHNLRGSSRLVAFMLYWHVRKVSKEIIFMWVWNIISQDKN